MMDPELLKVSSSIFGVPLSHRHCTLLNFKWPSTNIQAAVVKCLQDLEAGQRTRILLIGTPGLGKTHLAVALYRWAVLRWGTTLSTLVEVPRFFDVVKKSFNAKPDDEGFIEDPFREVTEAKRMVVLDDLLGKTPSPWEVNEVVFRLVNTIYTNSASSVVTSNLSVDQLGLILKPHEMSRLLEDVISIEFRGEDQRL